jgi:phosphatidate cytidylyltransferase
MYILPGLAPWVLGASVLWWALATWLVLTYPRSSEHWPVRLQAGDRPADPAAGLAGLVLIKHWPLGNWLIMAVMVLVWGPISALTFSGRAFGKRKLAPQSARARAGKAFTVAWR